jgi:hypothetical protein
MKTVRKEELTGPEGPRDGWAAAQDKVRERTSSGQGKLESALDYERNKQKRFDELFKKATDKHGPKPDPEA